MSSAEAQALVSAIAAGEPIEQPVLVVTAHPDDETIGLGMRLPLLRNGRLLQITDGAPAAMTDAHAAGFADRASYRDARAAERMRALQALGVADWPVDTLAVGDQEAHRHLTALAAAVRNRLDGMAAVLTHAYEGGHPDHDAAAFAVEAACRLLRRAGRPAPHRLEFAGYHLDGGRIVGAFPRGTDQGEPAALFPDRLTAKQAALAAYRSQAAVVAWFTPEIERVRRAPAYDYLCMPTPPGAALYDTWGWALTSEAWRAAAAEALVRLFGSPAPCRSAS